MAFLGVLFNFWLIIVGIFIYIGATEEAEQTILTTTMARVRVKDVIIAQATSMKPEATLAEAVDVMFRARYHDILIQSEGSLKGVVCWDDIMKVKPEMRNTVTVGQLPVRRVTIFPDESILDAYKIMMREKLDLIPVVDKDNVDRIIGVVTSEAVASAYGKAKTLR